MRQITTDRLIIRPISQGDYDELESIILDPKIVKYMRYRDVKTPSNFKKLFKDHFLKEFGYTFGIEDKVTHQLIGFYEFHPENGVGILSYALSQSAWGHGYVAEAGSAMMDYGFSFLNFDTIEAHFAHLNPRSGRVMEKMGMHDLGVVETRISPDNGEEIFIMGYALDRDEWNLQSVEQAG
ncbi:N-acetyltransferase [Companilactobacillus suantsaicola]|uniref:N-acetyltransferase n=1 Tax=Companilactobacillus suantsaicola TaxID=2487723 RepID=A0A4Z0JNC0_9LACO|nr:GNAT family N-acetyltransferase [Companilactobacillus suantsaicola]TGD23565.1 N-acetyltransferase [Companilactobacillus suantsaicola]